MSAPERPAIGVGALSDKELEILRLLATGHTVKSISARLGRSETSINERLRDARRKTGVGSSRELARHVAAQKIWDKNIDLSMNRPVIDGRARSPFLGRPISKGTIIMFIAMAFATARAPLRGSRVDRAADARANRASGSRPSAARREMVVGYLAHSR